MGIEGKNSLANLLESLRNGDCGTVAQILEIDPLLLAERDGNRRSLLQIAIQTECRNIINAGISMKGELIKSLLEADSGSVRKLDINEADEESGFTALHSLLFSSCLNAALSLLALRPDADLSVQDNDGNTCLDVLDLGMLRGHPSHIGLCGDDSMAASRYPTNDYPFATSVWTWGSNSNMQLGHPNTNNRVFPERVEISDVQNFERGVTLLNLQQPQVLMMSLSKYHSVVLTEKHVLTFGFGSGGRLGLGNEETTLMPTVVDDLSEFGIASVATGPDHSLAITRQGVVYSWGSNKWGQLGYPTEVIGKIVSPSLRPCEVLGALKKVKIIGVCGSKYHSAAYSINCLFTWGWNMGQLGYPVQVGLSQLQQTPRKVTNLPQGEILQIAATNNSTAVLMGRGEVYVLANHGFKRVVFSALPKAFGLDIKSNQSVAIQKIVSGNHQYVGLAADGYVYLWSPPVEVEEYKATWQQINFPQTSPKIIWAARKECLAAKDVAIGIDSTILVTVGNGQVYLGTRRPEIKFKERNPVYFKFNRVPLLRNIKLVYASSSGAFSAVRFDQLSSSLANPPFTLREDLRRMMITTPVTQSRYSPGLVFSDVELAVVYGSSQFIFPSHRVILSCRSGFFKKIFDDKSLPMHGVTINNSKSKGRTRIIIEFEREYSPHAFSSVLELIYTGGFNRELWNNLALNDIETFTQKVDCYSKNQSDFYSLVRHLEVEEFNGSDTLDAYNLSFTSALGPNLSDMVLQLKNDAILFAHQLILAARSPFFNAMFGDESKWMLKRRFDVPGIEEGIVTVDLSHINVEIMEIVLDWLYTDRPLHCVLKSLTRENFGEYMRELVEIMSVADELLLVNLKEQISAVLSALLDLGNALEFLEVADMYDAGNLKTACLNFICMNLSTFIELRYLEEVPPRLLDDIEIALRTVQNNALSFVRGPTGFYAQLRGKVSQLNKKSSNTAKEIRERDSVNNARSRAKLNEERRLFRKSVEISGKEVHEIFELEMESIPDCSKNIVTPKSTKKSGNSWKRLESPSESEKQLPVFHSPSPAKSWDTPSFVNLGTRISLADIMQETAKESPQVKCSKIGQTDVQSNTASQPQQGFVVKKKSQKERKREQSVTSNSLPGSFHPSSPWNIGPSATKSVITTESWQDADSFWGSSPSSKKQPHSWTKPSLDSKGNASVRLSLSEIQQEELNRRKAESDLKEVMKKTSFAQILKEEMQRKELQEQFGANMEFKDGFWNNAPVFSAESSKGKPRIKK